MTKMSERNGNLPDTNELNLSKKENEEDASANDTFEPELDGMEENDDSGRNDGRAEIAAAAATAAIASAVPAQPKTSSSAVVPWVIAVIAIAALVFVLVRNTPDGSMNEAVGKMDGLTITKADLLDEIEKQFGEQQMISLVDSVAQAKIIDLESENAGVTVTDADVQKELENIMQMYGMASEDDLSLALSQSGATIEEFKELQVVPNLKIKLLFENKHPASEDDLKAYFEANKETTFATTPKEVQASHILLNTKEEAEAALAELKAGKDFAALAKEKSQDPGSKDNGGELGFFGAGVMNQRFETAAFALAKGETSEVVEADNGFHIIKVTDIKEAVVPAYDEVKDDVKSAYFDEKLGTELQAWLETLKQDRKYENLLADAPKPSASADAGSTPSASPEASPSAAAAQ